jgi:hypothetical protein
LIRRAEQAGVAVPGDLYAYREERLRKLQLIPPNVLYSPRISLVHSLEFLGDEASLGGLRTAQGANGSIGNSPAASRHRILPGA